MHICIIYIYIYTGWNRCIRPIHERLGKGTLGNISFENTKSRAGELCLLLDCMARARAEGCVFSQTPGVLPRRALAPPRSSPTGGAPDPGSPCFIR